MFILIFSRLAWISNVVKGFIFWKMHCRTRCTMNVYYVVLSRERIQIHQLAADTRGYYKSETGLTVYKGTYTPHMHILYLNSAPVRYIIIYMYSWSHNRHDCSSSCRVFAGLRTTVGFETRGITDRTALSRIRWTRPFRHPVRALWSVGGKFVRRRQVTDGLPWAIPATIPARVKTEKTPSPAAGLAPVIRGCAGTRCILLFNRRNGHR